MLEKRRNENEAKITELREKKAILEGEIIKSETSMHLESGDTEVSQAAAKKNWSKGKGN